MNYGKYNKNTGEIVAYLSIDPSFVNMYKDDNHDVIEMSVTDYSGFWVNSSKVLTARTDISGLNVFNKVTIGKLDEMFSNVPSDAWVKIRGTETLLFTDTLKKATAGGKITFNFSTVGTYSVKFIGKYSSQEYLIEAVDLSSAKQSKINEVNDKKEVVSNSGFMWNGIKWDSDVGSQSAINSVVTSINAGNSLPENYYWTSFENVNVPMVAADMISLSGAMTSFNFAVHDKSINLKDIINAATDIDDINSLDIDSGWPV